MADDSGALHRPVSAGEVARASVTYDAVQMAGEAVYWIEGRPQEGGHEVLVRRTRSGVREPLPQRVSVGTSLYGYGGGAYLARPGAVWFCDAQDGRVYRTTATGVAPLTPADDGAVYGDLHYLDRPRMLVCVRERRRPDGTTVAELVALADQDRPRVLVAGDGFYAAPRTSADGSSLCWLSWDDPNMPWDNTTLYTATVDNTGALSDAHLIAGGNGESVFCPQWGPDGALYFVSDRGGWRNLYRRRDGAVEPVLLADAELGVAQWELGYATYAFLHRGRIAVIAQNGTRQRLLIYDPSGTRVQELPYTSIKPYLATDGRRLALIGSHPAQPPTVAVFDTDTGVLDELAGGDTNLAPDQISIPERFDFTTRDGGTCHGLYYPPRPTTLDPPALIVRAHPGPTSNTPMRLDPVVQFFTSHGYAVADIDYRGSTGYGRPYRHALHGHWGVLDATDCIDAAQHLTATGRADQRRMVISGASAGGYTALHAVARSDSPFVAAAAHSAVIDPVHWRDTAPRFQVHHTDTLIGPWPANRQRYQQRSLLHHAAHITTPVLLTHGTADPITPVEDTAALADALHHLGTPCELVIFTGERHRLSTPHNITTALTAELAHYDKHCANPR